MEPLSHPGRRLSVGGGITRWNRSSLQPLPSLHLVRARRAWSDRALPGDDGRSEGIGEAKAQSQNC
jgi:hypothetical protein